MFNNSLDGFSIRVGNKDADGKTLRNVLIYDHRAGQGNNIVLSARQGEMMETADKMYLVLTLHEGCSYKDIMDNPKDSKTRPMVREKFAEKVVRYDLSEFKMLHTNEELFKNNYQMLNLKQLNKALDSMQMKNEKRITDFSVQLQKSYYTKSFNYLTQLDSNKVKSKSIDALKKFSNPQKLSIIEGAANIARSAKQYADSISGDYENSESLQYSYLAEWHRKYTLSIACIVLFFIGAPLGAIIRKGGLGMPVVISLIFFITFHILSITGEKLVKEGKMLPYQGMWMATVILLPIGIFLTYKATSDSSLFDLDAYINPIKRLFVRKKSDEKPE
jgi:lipopolysaccharide export system permease protein